MTDAYKICTAETPEELEDKVSDYLQGGYEPYGELIVTANLELVQVMVYERDEIAEVIDDD